MGRETSTTWACRDGQRLRRSSPQPSGSTRMACPETLRMLPRRKRHGADCKPGTMLQATPVYSVSYAIVRRPRWFRTGAKRLAACPVGYDPTWHSGMSELTPNEWCGVSPSKAFPPRQRRSFGHATRRARQSRGWLAQAQVIIAGEHFCWPHWSLRWWGGLLCVCGVEFRAIWECKRAGMERHASWMA